MLLKQLDHEGKISCSFETMKNVLVLVFSNLKHDARVMRQINWLRKMFAVTVVCFDAEETPGVRFVRIKQTKLTIPRKALLAATLLLKAYRTAHNLFHSYRFLRNEISGKFDLIIANDIDTLPLAFDLGKGAPVVFDAHEYAPRHFENNRVWRIFFQPFYMHLCRQYIPKTSAMLTVGEGLASEYARTFGVKPVIISNATRYVPVQPSPVTADRIRLVHHGIANPSRRLELMVEMMDRLDERFTLDLILMTSDYASGKTREYIRAFSEKASRNPRIKVLPPVKSDDVVHTINRYDIGVFLLPPVNFNYANTLPNKLFDFIQARLGIAIGPTPEMAAIVNTYGNGVVSEAFEPADLAARLSSLTAQDVIRFKQQSALAAEFSWKSLAMASSSHGLVGCSVHGLGGGLFGSRRARSNPS
jgi:glycosyltransferase involved in cell wall biosynthesis